MSLKKLPEIKCKATNEAIRWDTPSGALSKWDSGLISAASDDATLTIYDVIGADGWTGEGMTAKRVAGILRSIGDRDVTVSINSPGGDFFEGIAIYNLLREHTKKVTVKVVGLAASAASIIAMAGDEILVAKSGFLMIHNAWAFVVGNKNDLKDAATVLDEFDGAMADLYASATGKPAAEISKMMDAETWLSGQSAVDNGFATGLLPSDEIGNDEDKDKVVAAIRKIDVLLAKHGMPRSERKSLLHQIKGGTPGAAATVTPGADLLADIALLTQTIRGKSQ